VQESVTSNYNVTTEGADTLKSLRYQGLHIETNNLESGVGITSTEGEKAV
jgi:identified by metaGeneAnnotator